MKKMLLRTLKIAGLVVLALLSTIIIVAVVKSPKSLLSKPVTVVDGEDYIKINNIALEHLAQSTTIPVIGYDDANNDSINHHAILDFHQWVKNTYPLIAKNAKCEIINQHSLLITLKGQSNKAAAMFLGHFDVVPTPDSVDWKHKPFKGTIAKDTLWGRGALDDKNVIVALLEAAEYRLSKGFQFRRKQILLKGDWGKCK